MEAYLTYNFYIEIDAHGSTVGRVYNPIVIMQAGRQQQQELAGD
jgi:hypothetical protein